MPIIAGGPPHDLIPPYRETHNQRSGEIVFGVMCDWQHRKAIRVWYLGDSAPRPGKKECIRREHALACPADTSFRCVDMNLVEARGAFKGDRIEGFTFFDNRPQGPVLVAGGAQAPTPQGKIVFEARFRRPNYALGDDLVNSEFDRYVVSTTNMSAESLVLPADHFVWDADKAMIPEGMAILRFMQERHHLWLMVPDGLLKSLAKKTWPLVVGRVNKAEFDGFPAGHVLCLPPRVSELGFTATDNSVRDCEYVMLSRLDQPWNNFFRRNTGFRKVVAKAVGGLPPYDEADFDTLFQNPDAA